MIVGETNFDRNARWDLETRRGWHYNKTGEFLDFAGGSSPLQYIPLAPEPTDEQLMEFAQMIKDINEIRHKIRRSYAIR